LQNLIVIDVSTFSFMFIVSDMNMLLKILFIFIKKLPL